MNTPERDAEIYKVAAKAVAEFREEYPGLDRMDARALIVAIEAARPLVVADALAGLLTEEEHRAVQLSGELWGVLCRIVGDGRTRDADLGEAIVHIHALQHAVMSQAAARAYPDRYRLLGETLVATSEAN